ncbi:hypothetical protein [Paenibacillus thermotolerans]|uniref:hypothetical protein n=1 Tax=Paenibacillus thermotolerans TaxID=3027807 RepID=UPI0023675E86|nr:MULTISPECIES: hypothetical protein [unclassified Paenibacillus]
MYADWMNQTEQLSRYAFAFLLLLVAVPKLLFRRTGGDLSERVWVRFMLMTLLLIILGYGLVLTKLFEVLAIVPALGLIAARGYIAELLKTKKRRELNPSKVARIYDWLEGKYQPRDDIERLIKRKYNEGLHEFRERIRKIPATMESVLFIAVLAVSAWIRFYDAAVHAAPGMTDGYVTLAWIKYIDQRTLFHDGIYPQGFHIWMDYLVKFAATDPLYILKYTGPLNAMLLMLGMYLAVSRWTGSRAAGILTVAVYGLLGQWLSGGAYERQASTNSQEFAFVFIFPTLYFLHRWLRDRARWALIGGVAGMIVVGLIHTLAYVYLGIGVAILLFIYLPLTWKERIRPLLPVVWGGAASLIISIIPLGIGFLLGRKVHSSSEDFATSRNQFISLPELSALDYGVLAAIVVIMFWTIRRHKLIRAHTGPLFAATIVLATFAMYYFGNLFTFPGSTVITARSAELWALAAPIGIGTAGGLVIRGLESFHSRWTAYSGAGLVAAAVAVILAMSPPQPIIPYKMEWGSGVEQYLKISSAYRPKTWMIVSPAREGYAVVLGNGHHLDTAEFLDLYEPNQWPLARKDALPGRDTTPKEVFIYYQKNIFQVSETNAIYPLMKPEYDQRAELKKRLDEWLAEHRKTDGGMTIWYEDENLRIYHISMPENKEKQFERIWGKGG